MRLTLVLYLIAIIFFLTLQTAYLQGFNLFWASFNLFLIFLVLVLFVGNFKNALIFAILSGLILDIYSSLPFGLYLVVLFLTVLILQPLVLNFFTNHSLYSLLALNIIGVVVYNFLFWLAGSFLYLIGRNDFSFSSSFWLGVGWQLVIALAVASFIFYFLNKNSRLFKPIFLNK